MSYASSIADLDEKKNHDEGDVREGDNLEEEEVEEEEQEELVEASDNFQACLQVIGAFFMMFNSWYVAFFPMSLVYADWVNRGICNT